jgi:3-oxoacyl-[acyl-carrier-protein] synthase-3
MSVEAYIISSGTHLPERIVTNEDIAGTLGLEPDYIFKFSGIRRRRWASPNETTSLLASAALRLALDNSGLTPEDIDYLLFGTMTPDRFIPGSASAVQKQAGLREIPCLDIRATCCNALYGLQLASSLIKSGAAHNVAICLSDIQSAWLDLSPEAGKISMLFGDGASALIVSAEHRKGSLQILDVLLATDGTYLDDLGIRCPGTEFGTGIGQHGSPDLGDFRARMAGQSVILQASRRVVAACQSVLERNGLTVKDVRWLVPHQANANLLSQIARNLNISMDDGSVVSVLEEYGNTSSASMGIALDTLRRADLINIGDNLLLPAFGAGFTWGAGLCRVS